VSQSVLLVPFAEVLPIVEPWLERSIGARPSHGIPPHVTLLFPFPPADEDVLAATEDALGSFGPLDVAFRETRRFPDVVYLAPEPAEPFVEMTKALGARFPEWPPYEGRFPSIVPHLTIASGEALDAAEEDVSRRLPLHARAATALLLSEVRPKRWTRQAEFRLGGG